VGAVGVERGFAGGGTAPAGLLAERSHDPEPPDLPLLSERAMPDWIRHPAAFGDTDGHHQAGFPLSRE
jgi:hypothetical protein